MTDYIEFLNDVTLFRAVRDMDDNCCPGPPAELWLDIRLENIASDKTYDDETRRYLILASKFAELIDDRKAWLLEEVENDLIMAETSVTA